MVQYKMNKSWVNKCLQVGNIHYFFFSSPFSSTYSNIRLCEDHRMEFHLFIIAREVCWIIWTMDDIDRFGCLVVYRFRFRNSILLIRDSFVRLFTYAHVNKTIQWFVRGCDNEGRVPYNAYSNGIQWSGL